jgi:toxin FitB
VTYLLDTNVLSETRKRRPATGVANWIAATPADRLHVSVLTLGEIEQGIARVRGRGGQSQASALDHWLHDVEAGLEDRILPVTLRVAAA